MSATAAKDLAKETFTVVTGQTGDRTPIFSVLAKRTYDVRAGQPLGRAEQTRPFLKADVYYAPGDPEVDTLKYEAELAAYKPATDVVVVGKAHCPGGKPAARVDVAVEVGERRKVIRVVGDRRCQYRANRDPDFTDPVPFTEMEIRYERAYGGTDLLSDPALPLYYPRNFQGTGLAVRNIPEVVDNLALPNLEDPADLLTPERVVLGESDRWNRQPLPQGLGWFQATWYPRCSFVGVVPGFVALDEVMKEETLGLVPAGHVALSRQFKLPSFDVRFCNGASPGLAMPYLRDGEMVRLRNLTPEGYLEFFLPREAPRIVLDIGFGENQLQPVLHTVLIRPEERQVDLIWRGAHEYPGPEWLPEMKRMNAVVT